MIGDAAQPGALLLSRGLFGDPSDGSKAGLDRRTRDKPPRGRGPARSADQR